jgi:uncharacterized membrane protein YfcA
MDPVILIVSMLIIGVLAGIIGGFLGVGGGILMVPALVLLMGVDFHTAKASSLFAIVYLSIIGTLRHRKKGNVDWKLGISLGAFGVIGALAGAWASLQIDTTWLKVIFGILLLLSSARMFTKAKEKERKSKVWIVIIGLGGGFVAGLLGIGGGIILVQGMVYIGVAIHTAVGTSLMAIIMNAYTSTAFNGFAGLLPYETMVGIAIPMTVGACFGVIVGAHAANKSKPVKLKQVFAVALAVVGVYMILRALDIISIG